MYDSVRDAWHSYSEPLEGREYGLYLDVFGLVTCGVGNLIDSVSEAQKLPWKRDSDNAPATPDEVAIAWRLLKSRQDLKRRSAKHARALTQLHLDDADIDALVANKLASNEAHIFSWFPGFSSIPADAQLAILSMAWAVGPAFNKKFPSFTKAALAGDWFAARSHGKIKEEGADGTPNPGVIPRNRANAVCFMNAHFVAKHGLERSVLHWPAAVNPEVAEAEERAAKDTVPEPFPLPDPVETGHAAVQGATSEGLREMSDDGESEPPPPGSVA